MIGTLIFGFLCAVTAFFAGKYYEYRRWDALRGTAITGQRLFVTGIGDVFVLGYSDDNEYVDLIPDEVLDGKWPDEIDPDILDNKTFSVPTQNFLAQIAPNSFKRAAKLS